MTPPATRSGSTARCPNVGLNPALLAPPTAKTYNGSKRLDSGVPAPIGPPKPFNVTFTKAGTYKFFCDVHPGMIGTVVVKPAGAAIPSAKQDAAATVAQVTADVKAAKKAAATKLPANTVSLGVSAPGGVELFNDVPGHADRQPQHGGDLPDVQGQLRDPHGHVRAET